jgi:hypothetical protein
MGNQKRQKKQIVIALIVIGLAVCLPFQAAASPGKLYGMGLTTDALAWMLSADEGYFLDNPAILMQLQPQLWVELTDLDGGLLLNPTNSMALYLLSGVDIDQTGFAVIPASTTPVLNEELIRLGLGFSMGTLDLGVSASFGTTGASDDTTGAITNHHTILANFNGGILLTFSDKMNIDAAGGVSIWNLQREFEAAPANKYDAGTLDFYASGRLNWAIFPKNTFHIYGKYIFENRSYTLGAAAKTDSIEHQITAGVSDEIQLMDNLLILAGAYFSGSYTKVIGVNSNNLDVTGHLGTEVALNQNFMVRAGVVKGLWNSVYDGVGESGTINDSTTNIYLGLGIQLGNFALDMNVDTDLFIQGPNFITNSTPGNWTAEISCSYYFDKAKSNRANTNKKPK